MITLIIMAIRYHVRTYVRTYNVMLLYVRTVVPLVRIHVYHGMAIHMYRVRTTGMVHVYVHVYVLVPWYVHVYKYNIISKTKNNLKYKRLGATGTLYHGTMVPWYCTYTCTS